MRSTSTGGAQGLASRNVPVASTGTALTPSTTATVMQTTNNGKTQSQFNRRTINEFRIDCLSDCLGFTEAPSTQPV